VDVRVREFVLLLAVEHDAVLIDEVQDRHSPFRGAQELHESVVFPFLGDLWSTFSAY
jgi:hypothetical protein